MANRPARCGQFKRPTHGLPEPLLVDFPLSSHWRFFSLLTGSLRIALSGGAFMTSPAFAFSGTGFPLLAMSSGAYAWAMLLPFTHHALLQTKLLQMQAPINLAMPTLIGFAVAGVLFFSVNILLLQRALQRPEKWGAR